MTTDTAICSNYYLPTFPTSQPFNNFPIAKALETLEKQLINVDRVAATQKLLDGAIAVARKAVLSSSSPPALTYLRWVWRLAGAYHLSHSTPRLMEEAAQHFASAGRERLAQWALQKAHEERGHARIALLDIQSMGYDPQAVVKAIMPPTAKLLLDYFTRSVRSSDPLGCVGYSYTMERLALRVEESHIKAVEALLPPGIQATRFQRVHSSVGNDVQHVKETVAMVTELPLEACIQVATACYETALLCFSSPRNGYVSEEELQNVLKPLETQTCSHCSESQG